MGIFLYNLGKSGMCCNLNHYIHACGYAESQGLDIRPVWRRGLYSKPGKDAWPQFFERPKLVGQVMETGMRTHKGLRRFAIVSPRGAVLPKVHRDKYHCNTVLMPPTDRARAHALIKKHIVLRDHLAAYIAEFAIKRFSGRHVVGLHLRGSGRIHGGAIYFSEQLRVGWPSYPAYFARVDKHLTPDSIVLLCTDAGEVVETVTKRYGDRVVVASMILPEKGEPHLANKYAPYQLGLDVLSDAYLLAKSNVFVHGNSNVSNYVLCLAPKLPHEDIYGHLYGLAKD